MPETAADRYASLISEIGDHADLHKQTQPELIAVSKTFDVEAIRPVLNAGCRVFGENRVQEAQGKWPELRKDFPAVKLHLIGPLQSNKTADAVKLFDAIHTIDREKIANAIRNEMMSQEKELELFIQVNTGSEEQKSGIYPDFASEFITWCKEDLGLTISGLMCIPPFEENPGPHFALLRKLADENDLDKLSMGMSGDYLTAIEFSATHVRVGSAIFGAR